MRNLMVVLLCCALADAHAEGILPEVELVTVWVTNSTSQTIGRLTLSEQHADDWSEEVLVADVDPSRTLSPGETDLILVPAGVWDLLVELEDGTDVMVVYNQPLQDGDTLVLSE